MAAFARPNATMKVRAAVYPGTPKTSFASSGTTVRSWPSIPPTRALTPTSTANWARLARRPSWIGAELPDVTGVMVKDTPGGIRSISEPGTYPAHGKGQGMIRRTTATAAQQLTELGFRGGH